MTRWEDLIGGRRTARRRDAAGRTHSTETAGDGEGRPRGSEEVAPVARTRQPSDDLERRRRRLGAVHLAARRYQDGVEELMAAHVPLARVEDAIYRTHLSEDQKAALWLLAWSLDEPARIS